MFFKHEIKFISVLCEGLCKCKRFNQMAISKKIKKNSRNLYAPYQGSDRTEKRKGMFLKKNGRSAVYSKKITIFAQ